MLEIIAVILLCTKNSANAKARGKSGGAAIAYTLGLWFGCEILGAMIGIMISGDANGPVYIMALLFAAGGGVGSYFIAKSGNVIEQAPAQFYPQQTQPVNTPYPNQQFQPQNSPVQPPVQPSQQEIIPPTPNQAQSGTSTITFLAKKVPGQFLVSSTTVVINGTLYQAEFNQPINILAPAGNVQIECYMNYLGKSGTAQIFVALEPNKTYQLEYKSPVVMTSSGNLTIIATS